MDNPAERHHILKKVDEEVRGLRALLMRMGGLVEIQLKKAVQLIAEGNEPGHLEEVLAEADHVNALELELDKRVGLFIARQSPIASDLRLVMAISKIVADIERIGDEAERIAKHIRRATDEGLSTNPPIDFSEVAEIAQEMVGSALNCLARLDSELALKILARDSMLDQVYAQSLRNLAGHFSSHAEEIGEDFLWVWVLRAFERVGDHSANVAEQVYFLVEGKDIRHQEL